MVSEYILEKGLHSDQVSVSQVSPLPNEILSHVIELAIPVMDRFGRRTFSKIRTISPRWRDLILENHRLWSYLSVSLGDISFEATRATSYSQLLEAWFSRSGHSITLSLEMNDGRFRMSEEEEHAMGRLVEKYKSRWQCLGLDLERATFWTILSRSGNGNWDNLRVFYVYGQPFDDTHKEIRIDNPLKNANAVTTLIMENLWPRGHDLLTHFKSVKHIEHHGLHVLDQGDIALYARFSNLTTLSITVNRLNEASIANFTRLRLERLVSMTMQGTFYCLLTLELFECPILSHLHLSILQEDDANDSEEDDSDSEDDPREDSSDEDGTRQQDMHEEEPRHAFPAAEAEVINAFKGFISPCQDTLQYFRLDGFDTDHRLSAHFLPHVPAAVTHLHLLRWPFNAQAFDRMMPTPWCPRLQSITILELGSVGLGDRAGFDCANHFVDFLERYLPPGSSKPRNILVKKGVSMIYFPEEKLQNLIDKGLNIIIL